jgi:photosystem II protein
MIASQKMQSSMLGKSLFAPQTVRGVVSVPPTRQRNIIVEAKKGLNFKPPGKVAKADYDKNAKKENSPSSAFTRRREVFAGRLAMSGFLAGCIGELLSGKGFLGQLSLEANLPPIAVNAIVAGIVGFNVLTALNPSSPTFSDSNQQDVKKRPKGPVQNPKINPIEDPQGFLGIDKGFGFTRKNELFVGRMAMIGFASAIIGEKLTGGKGPLAQIGVGLGQPLNTDIAGAALFLWIGVFLIAAIGYGTTDDSKYLGETGGDKSIY